MVEKPPLIPQESLAARLARELPGWIVENSRLRREYTTDGWPTTLMLANATGFVAEAADHHPELELAFGSLRVGLSTHVSGGVTERDLALAAEIERLALWRPPKGSALTGNTSGWIREKRP